MIWFKHMSNMIDDPKVRRLIRKHGALGYSVYNLVIERIAKRLTSDSSIPDLEETSEDLADLLNSDTAKIQDVILSAMQLGLFDYDDVTDRVICVKLYKFIEKSQTRSGEIRAMIDAYKQKNNVAVIESHGLSQTNLIEESRVEESKGEKSREKKKEDYSTADAVIDYLNAKADKRYRYTDANRRVIGARLRDGFSQQDCERVIDNKVAEWKRDATMNQYLRPSTLFAPSKFEGYLNQKTKVDTKEERNRKIERMVEEARREREAAG